MFHLSFNFYSCHKNFKETLSIHQKEDLFPVSLESARSIKQFNVIEESVNLNIDDLSIIPKKLIHPNDAYSYSITDKEGKKIVYATDGEYSDDEDPAEYCEFFKNAEMLIFDWQYSSGEIREKKGLYSWNI